MALFSGSCFVAKSPKARFFWQIRWKSTKSRWNSSSREKTERYACAILTIVMIVWTIVLTVNGSDSNDGHDGNVNDTLVAMIVLIVMIVVIVVMIVLSVVVMLVMIRFIIMMMMITLMVVMMVVNTRCRREEGTRGRHLTSDHGLPRRPLTRAVGLADYY